MRTNAALTERNTLLQTFGILSPRNQEEEKLHSQNFKAGPAWIKKFGQIESGPGALPGFKWWRAAANSP